MSKDPMHCSWEKNSTRYQKNPLIHPKTVDEICNMGFEKAQVLKAMKAAFNNPDRAIDYLFNVIIF
jgi:hypothetical protein